MDILELNIYKLHIISLNPYNIFEFQLFLFNMSSMNIMQCWTHIPSFHPTEMLLLSSAAFVLLSPYAYKDCKVFWNVMVMDVDKV